MKLFRLNKIFIYMKKICAHCGKSKQLKSFGIRKNLKNGIDNVCKICRQQKARYYRMIKTIDSESYPKLTGVRSEDYCSMYEFFETIGYDLSRDIHVQFCERHGLQPKKRPTKQQNAVKLEDCYKLNK